MNVKVEQCKGLKTFLYDQNSWLLKHRFKQSSG